MTKSNSAKALMIITALLGWIAIIAQFYLIIVNRVTSIPETMIRFFSFFTILSNIIVAVSLSVQIISPDSVAGKFWAAAKTQAAVTVYILVVGIVYNAVLRFLWAPTGLQRYTDELLHTVIPLLFVLCWMLYAPKANLTWRNAGSWLWFPFIYLVYTMIRGALTNYYPYPFLDAYNNGYTKVLVSSAVILGLFLLVSFILIAMAKKIYQKK